MVPKYSITFWFARDIDFHILATILVYAVELNSYVNMGATCKDSYMPPDHAMLLSSVQP